jgi:hypothetical protein
MNSWGSPGWVLDYHAEDELAEFLAYTSSADHDMVAREPSPIDFEAGTMPTDNRFWLHED